MLHDDPLLDSPEMVVGQTGTLDMAKVHQHILKDAMGRLPSILKRNLMSGRCQKSIMSSTGEDATPAG